MRTIPLITLLFLIGGCPSSAIDGKLTPIKIESKRSTPLQLCQATPEFIKLADKAMYLVLDEMDKAGLINKEKTVASMRREAPIICQIDQPEPCILTPSNCEKSENFTNVRCARKRGCGHEFGLWISRHWPPVCRDRWPDEPHCVNSAKEQSENGFLSDLCKESCEVICARNYPNCKSCYNDPQLSAFARAARRLHASLIVAAGQLQAEQ